MFRPGLKVVEFPAFVNILAKIIKDMDAEMELTEAFKVGSTGKTSINWALKVKPMRCTSLFHEHMFYYVVLSSTRVLVLVNYDSIYELQNE